MASVTFTIPNQYVSRILDAFGEHYPQPQVRNPDYDNPSTWPDPSSPPPEFINQYTDVAWFKLKVREHVTNIVRRYEERVATETAREGINIPSDLITD